MSKSNKNFFSYGCVPKNRKAVSIMIGYVLLVSVAIIMGMIAYQWMKTYVPKDALNCPDGVSVFVKDIDLNCTDFQLDLTLQNNGRFNIAGYFIHATNDSNQSLATIDLSEKITWGGTSMSNAVIFSLLGENFLKPNEEMQSKFNLTNEIYSIEITPVRFQIEEGKQRFVSCGDVKIKEKVVCG